VELWRESDFQVVNPFSEAILAEFVGNPLKCFLVDENGTGVCEPVKVVGEISVVVFKDEFPESF
jgi:hypothetical protein